MPGGANECTDEDIEMLEQDYVQSSFQGKTRRAYEDFIVSECQFVISNGKTYTIKY